MDSRISPDALLEERRTQIEQESLRIAQGKVRALEILAVLLPAARDSASGGNVRMQVALLELKKKGLL